MKTNDTVDMATFVRRHGIRLSLKEVGTRRDESEWPAGFRHFKATLHCGKRRMTVPYSQGPGITNEPKAETVLDCISTDASCAEYSFEAFCSEFGYDTDSRRAERIYKSCVKEADGLRRLLGDADFEFLLYKVERL